MILRQRQRPAGLISLSISILAFLLFAFNLLDQITKGQDLLARSYLTAPYLLILFLPYFIDEKIMSLTLFMGVGLYLTLEPNSNGDISGIIFFMFALSLFKNRIFRMIILSIVLISISIRSTIIDQTIFQTFSYMMGVVLIIISYYKLFNKKSIKNLTLQEIEILDLLAGGMSQKEAGYILGLDQSQANYLIKNIRKKCNNKPLNQVMFLYGKSKS